jgi:prepilin-type processing-associated H-X9-DG protein
MYVLDHSIYPAGATLSWPLQLSPYLDDQSLVLSEGALPGSPSGLPKVSTVFRCPAAPSLRNRNLSISYGYNIHGFAGLGLAARTEGETDDRTRSILVKEKDVVVPSDMIAIGDGIVRTRQLLIPSIDTLNRSVLEFTPDPHNQPEVLNWLVRQRHNGSMNVGFCDGHVETPTLERMFYDETDDALRRWNRDNLPHREALAQLK